MSAYTTNREWNLWTQGQRAGRSLSQIKIFTMQKYDSTEDTIQHKRIVSEFMRFFIDDLKQRSLDHDMSKLSPPEKEVFDAVGNDLKNHEYGSDEYKEAVKKLRPALDHHYAVNSHHPEHYPNGITGMNLLDIVEMFCDWKAANQRNKNGNILRSIEIQKAKKGQEMSEQLAEIFKNTELYLQKNKTE